MWRCHKCDKPVFFAERKQSLGYDWHPECLRCEECGKRLNPGQHAEHKGVPYCHVPCYGALFGPQLFGHGTKVESHKSFGRKDNTSTKTASNGGPGLSRSYLEAKLKTFNQYFDGRSGEIRSREVNGRLVFEGALRIHWGVKGVIHLKENDDQRTVVTVRKRNSCRYSINKDFIGSDNNISHNSAYSSDTGICTDGVEKLSITESPSRSSVDSGQQSSDSLPLTLTPPPSPAVANSSTLPPKLDLGQKNWDELDQLLQVERIYDVSDKMFQTMPTSLPSQSSIDSSESLSLSNSGSTPDGSNSISHSSLNSPEETKSDSVSYETLPADSSSTLKPGISNKSLISENSSVDTIGDYDDQTLKPSSDVDLKKLINRNNFMPLDHEAMSRSLNEDTLKANSPIDPKKIHDSLKLYGDIVRNVNVNEMSATDNFSINCEQKLEEMSDSYFNEDHHPRGTLRRVRNYEENINKRNNYNQSPKINSSAYNRAISMDNSWIGSNLDNSNNENYELSRSISGPEHFANTNAEDSASDSETINYAHPVDDYIMIPNEGKVLVKKVANNRTGSTAIKRRTGRRRQRAAALKRRCSINGHFYNRETSFFTPPFGSLMSVWVTSLVSTQEVINLMLDKYKVDSNAQRFALFVVRDNGEQRRLRDDEYPLLVRVVLGPHEEISKLFLMDADKTGEVSSEVAQFLNLSIHELEAILQMYHKEEQRETARIQQRYTDLRQHIKHRMETLKVRL